MEIQSYITNLEDNGCDLDNHDSKNSVWGRVEILYTIHRCADTSPTLIVACGFTHWTQWRYRALELVASWAQWSPTARGVASVVWPRNPSCRLLWLPLWDWRGFMASLNWRGFGGLVLASSRASDVARVVTLAGGAAWPRTGQNEGSPVARSKTAMWEFPTTSKESSLCKESITASGSRRLL
jgi:hypothetical protein